VFGYLQFGESTEGNILQNFPSDVKLINLARICMTVTAMFSYPLMNYINRKVIDFAIERCGEIMRNPEREDAPFALPMNGMFYWLRACGVSFIFMSGAWVLAIALPQIQLIFGLAGSIVIIITSFIVPCILHWRAHRKLVCYGMVLPWLIIIFGLIIGTLGTVATVRDIVEYFEDHH
jgi:sodium-coupled neutral amino acid transporter 11